MIRQDRTGLPENGPIWRVPSFEGLGSFAGWQFGILNWGDATLEVNFWGLCLRID